MSRQTYSGTGTKALRGLFSKMYPVLCNQTLQTLHISIFENKLLIFIRDLHRRRQAGSLNLRQLDPDKESSVPTVRPAARGVQLGVIQPLQIRMDPLGICIILKANMLIGSLKNKRTLPHPLVAFVEQCRWK